VLAAIYETGSRPKIVDRLVGHYGLDTGWQRNYAIRSLTLSQQRQRTAMRLRVDTDSKSRLDQENWPVGLIDRAILLRGHIKTRAARCLSAIDIASYV
jgi:hypothetical protein